MELDAPLEVVGLDGAQAIAVRNLRLRDLVQLAGVVDERPGVRIDLVTPAP